MSPRGNWRSLAITYGVVAVVQGYLAVTTGAVWAVVVAAVCVLTSLGCGVTARRVTERGEVSRARARNPPPAEPSRPERG
ncbi:hypothetical protein [Amycolatopsis samaneae]|uniref:4Fe-4S Mo/W bis-MGD-type domain-containing protein n=1 Tax=Amycolatopsis samaneae TaxID=664691 RepID=A0ABW5GMD5_9PSEU